MMSLSSSPIFPRPLIVLMTLSLLGAGGGVRAMVNEDEKGLFSSVQAMVDRFRDLTTAKPQNPGVSSKDQVILQGRFLTPHVLTQDQAREILLIDKDGRSIDSGTFPLHQQFKVQIMSVDDPLPIGGAISHSLFHQLLTGQEGILSTTLLSLKDVQIFTPFSPHPTAVPAYSTLQGMKRIPYYVNLETYLIMLQPYAQETLKDKLQGKKSLLGDPLSSLHLGSLLFSSFLSHPHEASVDNIIFLEERKKGPLAYLKPQTFSPAPICVSREKNKHFLEAKNALYLMPELMNQEVDPKLKTRLLDLDPSLFLLRWINLLEGEDKLYTDLLINSGLSLDYRIELGFPLTLPPRLIENLLKTLTSLKEALQTNPSSYQTLLEQLFPLVAYSYQELGQLAPSTPWESLSHVTMETDSIGRIFPAKSLEELLNLSGVLTGGKGVFEALEEERFPMGGSLLIQPLGDGAQKVIQQVHLKEASLEGQVEILSLLAISFKAQTLKLKETNKLEGFDKKTLDDLLYHAKDKASIELLFELGADPKTKNAQKETPLHARLKNLAKEDQEEAWPLLEALVKAEPDLNAEDNAQKTVFDLALENGLDFVFTHLVELTTQQWKPLTSIKLNINLLLKKYDQWIEDGRMDPELHKSFTSLSKMNSEIAWALSLREILPALKPLVLTYEVLSKIAHDHLINADDREDIEDMIQKKRSLEKIKTTLEGFLGKPLSDLQSSGKKVHTTFMGERCLLPEIEKQLFDNDGKVIRSNNIHGRRDVARIEAHGKVMYFKHLPELPGFEYAMHLLHQKLIGYGTPPSELIKINGQPFLISLGIEGENLQDVLKDKPHLLNKLDPQSTSALILMTMLTNPEDAKADNYILEPLPFHPNQYRLICVDNDHALTPTLARTDGPQAKTRLQVKSILYCLDQMKDMVSDTIKDLFYQVDPYKTLKGWLEELKTVNDRYMNLFPESEYVTLKKQECVVRVPFKAQMMTQAYDKMLRLQGILAQKKANKSKDLSHQEVLEALEPLLGARYKVGFLAPQSVEERFKDINSKYYGKSAMGGLVSTSNSSLILQTLGVGSDQSLLELQISDVLEELEAIWEANNREILQGDQAANQFKSLKSQNGRETFLSRFDFKDLTPKLQKEDLNKERAFLDLLKGTDPRNLTFKNCSALSEEILINNIGIGNLRRLTIEN